MRRKRAKKNIRAGKKFTHTVIPRMQEVKEFFCAFLLGAGSGVDAGLAQLQTLFRVHTVFGFLALGSYRFERVLENIEQMWCSPEKQAEYCLLFCNNNS